jgi:hypothetical protein
MVARDVHFRTKVKELQVIESHPLSRFAGFTFICALQARSRLFNKIIPEEQQMVEI